MPSEQDGRVEHLWTAYTNTSLAILLFLSSIAFIGYLLVKTGASTIGLIVLGATVGAVVTVFLFEYRNLREGE